MTTIGIVYMVYAVALMLGGMDGYVKTRSAASLIAGQVSGVAVIVAILLLAHHPRVALGLGAVVSAALIGVFARRYQKTRKAMPAVPLIVFSAAVLADSLALAGRILRG